MKWRLIGPFRGGKATMASGVPGNPALVYVATASGGLFKTTNGGTTWTPIFDRQATISIGNIAVDPHNPDVVWLGSGEANARNSVSFGDGVYRTLDGGKTLVSVPYSHEINDKPAFEKFNRTADQFRDMICRQFDVLYREGAQSGRVMAIAIHPYLTGVPHRIDAFDAALRYIGEHGRVWKTTGTEIARHYRAQAGKV